jgi:CRISPR-associated protein Csm5
VQKTFRKVKYITLSPLHIGDGNILSKLEYFPYKGKIHLYNSEDLKRFLTREQFEDFIKYATSNESPSLLGFFRTYSNTEQILKVASGKAPFSLSFWGSDEPSKIWTFIKSRNQPYIPGTEIKGALRTAILRKLILDGSSGSFISKEIKNIKNSFSSNKKEVRKELEKLEERISARAFRLNQRNDAKFDFMKFILISDAYSKNIKRLVANIQTKNTSRPIGDFHEIVPNNVEFQGEMGIVKEKQFEEFVNRFGADSQKKSFFSNLETIFTACYEMSKEVIEEEMKFYRRLKVDSAINQLEEIQKANSKNSPVIRIGKHQGFMSITLVELIKKLGKETYRDYVELLKSTGKRIDTNNFPKTRKVLINPATKEELTLGWIKIEVE